MNVEKLFVFILFCGWSILSSAEDMKIGEEYIEPLKYPKFSLGADYSLIPKFRELGKPLSAHHSKAEFTGVLSFEAGLYKYLKAGGMFSINVPAKGDPVRARLSVFAKPYIPFGERFALFARIGGGIGGWIPQGYPFATVNALATAGLEVFPFRRFGVGIEAGWRTEIILDNSEETRFFWAHEIPLALNFHIIL
jgi:hypothetical protein